MEPISVNNQLYIKQDGTWYMIQENNHLFEVVNTAWISGLEAIYSIDQQISPLRQSLNENGL